MNVVQPWMVGCTLVSVGGVQSATKSASACDLIAVLGTYEIPNCDSSVAHLPTLLEASLFLSRSCNGSDVGTEISWVWK